MLRAAACVLFAALVGAEPSPGFKIPSGVELHKGFPPEKVDLANYVAGRNVIVVGLPGAFTPT